MSIGERIKARRIELGMSQDELAKKIGYKSRSSINKIEIGSLQLRQKKIKEIAVALETTPSYIMGWDEEKPASNNETDLSNEFIKLFTQLTSEERKLILAQIKGILSSR